MSFCNACINFVFHLMKGIAQNLSLNEEQGGGKLQICLITGRIAQSV